MPTNAGDISDFGLILGLGRSPGERHGNPLQYPCLENPMDRGAWWATVHGITKSGTQLKQLSSSTHIYYSESESVSHSVMSDSVTHQAPLSMEFSRQDC